MTVSSENNKKYKTLKQSSLKKINNKSSNFKNETESISSVFC